MNEIIPAPITGASESVNEPQAQVNINDLPKWKLADFIRIHGKWERRRVVSNDPKKSSFERYAFPNSPQAKDGYEVKADFSKELLKQFGEKIVVKDKKGEDREFDTVSIDTLKKLRTSLMVYAVIHEDNSEGFSIGLAGEETVEEEDIFA